MSPFLDDGWLDLLEEAAGDLPEVAGASADVVVVVADAPKGEVLAHLTIEDGRLVSLAPRSDGDDPLELSCPYDLASAIVRGETTVSVAFMRGALKVSGNMSALYRILPLTDDQPFIELLRTVAARTEF